MRLHPRYLIFTLAFSACARASKTHGSVDAPTRLLDRAIERAGGTTALSRATALEWEGEAKISAGGRVISIAGHWSVQPPDTAVVTTYDVSRGPATTRALVIAAPRGWSFAQGTFTALPPGVLANERDEFYLYSAMMLLPLRDKNVALSAISPDTVGHEGLRVTRGGRPAVDLFMAADGSLTHLRATITDTSGKPVREDLWLEGVVSDGAIRWPRRISITLGGDPYFDLTITSLRSGARAADSLLTRLP